MSKSEERGRVKSTLTIQSVNPIREGSSSARLGAVWYAVLCFLEKEERGVQRVADAGLSGSRVSVGGEAVNWRR